MSIQISGFSQDYLYDIKTEAFARMDSVENGGNGDGKITVNEAYNDLQIDSLFSGIKDDTDEYKNLKAMTDKIPEALVEYSGEDEEFSPEEWAQFLNGDEWGDVLDAYHSSSGFAKLEMSWIDNKHIKDGMTTKGEVKVGLLNSLNTQGHNINTKGIEVIVDKYSGDDGTFSLEEYMALKNDDTYKTFLDKYNVSPYSDKPAYVTQESDNDKTIKTAPDETKLSKGFLNGIFDKLKSIFQKG